MGHNLSLLDTPIAQELLHAAIPARLAYVWADGTPRVIPIWFHWDGREIVLCSPPGAPKMKALGLEATVALTIDYEQWPARALLVRGTARSEAVAGEVPEYADMVRKYLGEEQAAGWRGQYAQLFPRPIRIAIRPEWVGIIDVTDGRFPSAFARAMAHATA